jgi:hypothetical protein
MKIHDNDTITIHKNNRFPLDVTPLRDTRISWAAKGLLIWMLTCDNNIDADLQFMSNQTPDGKFVTELTMSELMLAGYVTVGNERDAKGMPIYSVHETPRRDNDRT